MRVKRRKFAKRIPAQLPDSLSVAAASVWKNKLIKGCGELNSLSSHYFCGLLSELYCGEDRKTQNLCISTVKGHSKVTICMLEKC